MPVIRMEKQRLPLSQQRNGSNDGNPNVTEQDLQNEADEADRGNLIKQHRAAAEKE